MANFWKNFVKSFKSKTLEQKNPYKEQGYYFPIRSYIPHRQKIENLKALDISPHLQNLQRKLQKYYKSVVQTPKFNTFWNFYQIFDEISTPVNRNATRVAGLSGYLIDKNGFRNDKRTKELNLKTNLAFEAERFVKHLQIYGQVVPVELTNGIDTWVDFVPSHQIILWEADDIKIQRFQWHDNLQHTREITEGNFSIYKMANSWTKYFGQSPIEQLYSKVNLLHLDIENISNFFQNGSFVGVIGYPKENLSDAERDALQQTLDALNKPDAAYSGILAEGLEKVEQLRIDIQSKLTAEEKRHIERASANALGYPYIFLSESSGGLGQGQQVSARQQYIEEAINYYQSIFAKYVNEIKLPLLFTKEVVEDEGLEWIPNPMQAESDLELADLGLRLKQAGLISSKELKIKYLKFKDNEIDVDDEQEEKQDNQGQVAEEDKLGAKIETEKDVVQDTGTNNSTNIATNAKSFVIPDLKAKHKKSIHGFFSKNIENLKSETEDNSKVPKVLETKEAKKLQEIWKEKLLEQYQSLDLKKLFKDLKLTELLKKSNINEKSSFTDIIQSEDFKTELNEYIVNNTDSLDLDSEDLIILMLFFASLGKQEAINQALEAGVEDLTPEERTELNSNINKWINQRLETLAGQNNKEGESGVQNPILANGLDKTSYNKLTEIIIYVLAQNPTATEDELINLINQEIEKRADVRSNSISNIEAILLFQVGLYLASKSLNATGKEWLKTLHTPKTWRDGKNWYDDHLSTVSTKIPINQIFKHRKGKPTFWSGEVPNCLCGIRLHFEGGKTADFRARNKPSNLNQLRQQ